MRTRSRLLALAGVLATLVYPGHTSHPRTTLCTQASSKCHCAFRRPSNASNGTLSPLQCEPSMAPPTPRRAGPNKINIVVSHCCEHLASWLRRDSPVIDLSHVHRIYVYEKCAPRCLHTLTKGSNLPPDMLETAVVVENANRSSDECGAYLTHIEKQTRTPHPAPLPLPPPPPPPPPPPSAHPRPTHSAHSFAPRCIDGVHDPRQRHGCQRYWDDIRSG